MPLPHFSATNSNTPTQIMANHFDVKFYNENGNEISNIYTSVINITEKDSSYSAMGGGIIRKMNLTISSNIEFIANFENISKIKYCYFNIHDRNGVTTSDRIFKIELSMVQSRFDYSLDSSFQENDCDFIIREEHNITGKNTTVDDAIKIILRGKKIDDILTD